jgi:hypothetical protein
VSKKLKVHRPDVIGIPLCGARGQLIAQDHEEVTCQSCNYIHAVEERKAAPRKEVQVLQSKVKDLEQILALKDAILRELEEENTQLRLSHGADLKP